MKNIILVILAILFIIIILFHFMNVQLEHFDCKQSDDNDKVSKLFYNIRIPQDILTNVQNIINSNGKYTDDSIIQSLINLNIPDTHLSGILTDNVTYPSSTDKLAKFKCVLKAIIKSEFDDGLIIHYPLDEISSDSRTIENKSINVAFAPDNQRYNGTLEGTILPFIDSNDSRKSMKFGGKTEKEGGDIRIDKLPSFWDKTNTKFLGFSLAVWAKASPYPLNNHWSRIVDFAMGEYYNNNIFISVTNTHNPSRGDLAFIVCNGSWDNPDIGSGLTYVDPEGKGVVDDIWRHYVFTITPSNASGEMNYKIYVNGVLVNSNYYNLVATSNQPGTSAWSITGPDPALTKPPNNLQRTRNFIGRSNFPWDSYFNGWMLDFRIYTKELSADVIKRLYDFLNEKKINADKMFNPAVLAQANGAIPAFPGAPPGPAPKTNILLFSVQQYIQTNNDKITWADYSGSNNNAVASDAAVKFCPITKKITVPSGSYLDIAVNPQCNYAAPVTIFIVADVKDFNTQRAIGSGGFACNHLFSSNDNDGLFIGFTGNHIVCGIHNRASIVRPLDMYGLNASGKNIYTIQLDQTGMARVWINSNLVVNEKMPTNAVNQNKKIRLGCSFEPFQYASADNIDYHQLVHVSGILTTDYISFAEAWMASAWGIKSRINPSNTYLNYQFS